MKFSCACGETQWWGLETLQVLTRVKRDLATPLMPPTTVPIFGPETSRTSVRGHREQFAILSREAIEVDGFHFLMSEPGAEDAVCCSRAKGDRLADDSLAQAYGTAEDRAAERGGRDRRSRY